MGSTVALKLLSALVSLGGAALLVASLFSPHFLNVHEKHPGALVQVSAWLGFLKGEMVWKTFLEKPAVVPFNYKAGALCKDACNTLRKAGMYGTAALCLASVLLVGAATLVLAACPMQTEPPLIGRPRLPLHPHLVVWSRHLCIYAANAIAAGVLIWFLMLQRLGGEYADMGLHGDTTASPGLSLWLVVGGFASVVGNTVILTVVRLFERLRVAEGRGSQEHTPLVSLI